MKYLLTAFLLLGTTIIHAQVTYETIRDSGLRAYKNLLFEDALKQFEAAKILARGQKVQETEIVQLIDSAKNGYIDAILKSRAEAKALLLVSQAQQLIDKKEPKSAYQLLAEAYEQSQSPTSLEAIHKTLVKFFEKELGSSSLPFLKLPLGDTLVGWSQTPFPSYIKYSSNGMEGVYGKEIPKIHYTFQAQFGPINAVAVSPDGECFVTGGDDSYIRCRKANGEALWSREVAYWMKDMEWHPSGRYFVASFAHGQVYVFGKDGKFVKYIQLRGRHVEAIAFEEDQQKGDVIFRISLDGDSSVSISWKDFLRKKNFDSIYPQYLLKDKKAPEKALIYTSPNSSYQLRFLPKNFSTGYELYLVRKGEKEWKIGHYKGDFHPPIFAQDASYFIVTDGFATVYKGNPKKKVLEEGKKFHDQLITSITPIPGTDKYVLAYWDGKIVLWRASQDYRFLLPYLPQSAEILKKSSKRDFVSYNFGAISLDSVSGRRDELPKASYPSPASLAQATPQYGHNPVVDKKVKKLVPPPGCSFIPATSSSPTFWMDEMEISNSQWQEYLDDIGSTKDYKDNPLNYRPDSLVWREGLAYAEPFSLNYFLHPAFKNYPVVGISYEQALAYCRWRSQKLTEKVRTVNTTNYNIEYHFRLPSPEEWETGANIAEIMGLTSQDGRTRFKTKINKESRFNCKEVYATYQSSREPFEKYSITCPVDEYQPNLYGLYNTLGNVAEMTDIRGVCKGGSWEDEREKCFEYSYVPRLMIAGIDHIPQLGYKTYLGPQRWLGFRCVCDVVVTPKEP